MVKNHTQPDGGEEANISGEYQAGKRKLRILGLTDPEKGMSEAKASLDAKNTLFKAVKVSSSQALEVLGNNTNPSHEEFEAPVMLIRDDYELQGLMQEKGIVYNMNTSLFDKEVGGYHFAHRFMSKRREEQTLATVHIDGAAIDDSIREIGLEEFKELEKSLGALYTFTNHDYTMHRHGLALNGDVSGMSYAINNKLDFDVGYNIAGNTEVASALFHRDMLEEMGELGMPILDSIEKHAKIVLSKISKIENKGLQKYWMMSLKYPLFSLIDPTQLSSLEDTGDQETTVSQDIMKRLRNEFPDVNLEPTQWGKAVHKKELDFEIGPNGERQAMSTRNFRKIAMPGLHDKDPKTRERLVSQLGKLAGYRGDISDWDDLDRISRARKYNLSDDTPKERLDDLDQYEYITGLLDTLEKSLQNGEEVGSMDVEGVELQMLELRAKDFDFSQYDSLDWEKAFQIRFEYQIGQLIESYEADSEKEDMHFAYQIEDLIEESKERGYDMSNITLEDWYQKNNRDILSHLRLLEHKALEDIGFYPEDNFNSFLSRVKERNKEKKGAQYILHEFEDYNFSPMRLKSKLRNLSKHILNMRIGESILDTRIGIRNIRDNGIQDIKDLGGDVGDIEYLVEDIEDVSLEKQAKILRICESGNLTPEITILIQATLFEFDTAGVDIKYFGAYIDLSFLENNKENDISNDDFLASMSSTRRSVDMILKLFK